MGNFGQERAGGVQNPRSLSGARQSPYHSWRRRDAAGPRHSL